MISVLPFSETAAEALRGGRWRRHGRGDGWSARFALLPGPDGDSTLDRVEELAVCMGRAGGLDPDAAVFVGVALREAVVNAFRHGRNPERHPIRIALHLTPECLSITVRDRGPGFDPARVRDPHAQENLCRGSGRGIYYMRRFTDRLSFCFPRTGGSVVRLDKRTGGAPPNVLGAIRT